jgi:hypothetical protein
MRKLLPRNERPIERAVRVALGLFILAFFFFGARTPWALLGIVPLVTGLVGSCPLYTLFGISSCRTSTPGRDATAPTR